MLSLLSSSSDAMAMVSAPGARTFNMDTGNAVEVMLASAVVDVVAMITLGSDRADLSHTLGMRGRSLCVR
jgi:hypothetical protein